jgi:hypothetical protein
MAYSLTQFANNTAPQLSALDNNTLTLSGATNIQCSVTGTNTLTLTQNAAGLVPSSALTAYSNYLRFTGTAAATNTGATTANIGGLGALNVYKDGSAGPVALAGGEIVANCAFTLIYDSALNAGAGGFHLISNTANALLAANPSQLQINGGATLSRYLSTLASITLALATANTAQTVSVVLTGVSLNDNIILGPPANHPAGWALTGFVLAAGTVGIGAVNGTSVSIGALSAAYRVSAFG